MRLSTENLLNFINLNLNKATQRDLIEFFICSNELFSQEDIESKYKRRAYLDRGLPTILYIIYF